MNKHTNIDRETNEEIARLAASAAGKTRHMTATTKEGVILGDSMNYRRRRSRDGWFRIDQGEEGAA